jgi:hypothetical protein
LGQQHDLLLPELMPGCFNGLDIEFPPGDGKIEPEGDAENHENNSQCYLGRRPSTGRLPPGRLKAFFLRSCCLILVFTGDRAPILMEF